MICSFKIVIIDEAVKICGDAYLVILSFLALTGLVSAVGSFKKWDAAKVSWMMILLGTISFFIAECTYFYLEIIQGLNIDDLFPSIGDFFWAIGYIFYFAGVVNMIIAYLRSGLPLEKWKRHLIPAAIFFIIFVCAMYVLILEPITQDQETDPLTKFLYFYYPIGDLAIIFPAFFLMYITSVLGKGKLSRPWWVIGAGFMVMAAADLAFNYLDWQELYQTGNNIDILWGISYWLIGLSGFYQKELLESI